MSEYVYPGNDLDRASTLLATIGSYWSESYRGNDLLRSALFATAQNTAQTHLDFLELIASISRFDIPIFHTENWYLLTFKESELNSFDSLVRRYNRMDPPDNYRQGTNLRYGVPQSTNYSVKLPKDLLDFKLVMNRITEPSLTWVNNVDFQIPEPGVLTFNENPFENPLITQKLIWKNGEIVDREASLWIFRGQWDWDTVYEQFGYVINLQLKSSEGYKQLINAIFDALIEGTKVRDVQYAWSAITGIPLVIEHTETVQSILQDAQSEVVITDQHAYKFPLNSTVIVSEGEVLHAGDPLVNTLEFFELNQGAVPDDIQGLAFGPGFLATGFWGDLVWENKDTPLIVEAGVDGYTKVSWDLGGFPADIERFWDLTHASGITRGKTIAQMLDIRDNPPEEPLAASLPATINPLKFLCENLLRYHTYVVRVRPGKMGKAKLGLHAAVNLKRIVPPHTAMIVLVELEYQDDPIIMDGPGTAEAPGYEESASGFPVMTVSETVSVDMLAERVRIFQIAGKCE